LSLCAEAGRLLNADTPIPESASRETFVATLERNDPAEGWLWFLVERYGELIPGGLTPGRHEVELPDEKTASPVFGDVPIAFRIPDAAAASLAAIDGILQQLKSTAGEPLIAADGGQAAETGGTGNSTKWPPDEDWHFRPGEAAFLGVPIPTAGKLWGVLKALADARGAAVTWGDLADAVSPDTTPEPQAIRGYVSKVRAALRKAFGLDSSIDPIPNVEWGKRTSWRLDPQALRVAAQKQR
jgi:hypothetical protein